jgi:hypothetical protein
VELAAGEEGDEDRVDAGALVAAEEQPVLAADDLAAEVALGDVVVEGEAYLAAGDDGKLRRRLEGEVKSLHAFHEYGRLHHHVRLRWGFLDERLPAPWVHGDEPYLGEMMKRALALRTHLEVVVGSAPGWADPWARVIPARVVQGERSWEQYLIDDEGMVVREEDVQLARLAVTVH